MIAAPVNIRVERTEKSRISEVDFDNLKFGRTFSDHMLVMEYEDGEWKEPVIRPFGELTLHPAISSLHYGQSIFEGLKAYKNDNGEVLLFRPDANAARFVKSAERMCMPPVPDDVFVHALNELLKVDSEWVPAKPGYSLYIRPFQFATDEYVGIRPSEKYTFIIFTCPVGAYYSEPLRVRIESFYTRAAEGGVGQAKTAGNYAASLYPAKQAQQEGYHQLIWTDAKEHKYIEESGTMNIIFHIGDKLITPEVSGTILPGITRDSVLSIARDWGYEVEERKVSVNEIVTALDTGTLKDAFGAGTAATIAQIHTIGVNGKDYQLPRTEDREFSNKVFNYLNDLKKGLVEDPYNWVKKVS